MTTTEYRINITGKVTETTDPIYAATVVAIEMNKWNDVVTYQLPTVGNSIVIDCPDNDSVSIEIMAYEVELSMLQELRAALKNGDYIINYDLSASTDTVYINIAGETIRISDHNANGKKHMEIDLCRVDDVDDLLYELQFCCTNGIISDELKAYFI
jgi:hypothetical protein